MFTLRKLRATTSIADLDDDTLVEIITRLSPIKHMVSCKLVSKRWCTLISTLCIPKLTSPPVYALLFNTCPNPSIGERGAWTFAYLDGLKSKTSLLESCLGSTLPFRPSPTDFLDCCNGMLLFFDPSSMHYYVCNPSTQQCVSIPNPRPDSIPLSGVLFFDPHYKVAHISHLPSEPPSMYIFSPATHKWDTYQLNLESSVAHSPWAPCSVFMDGSIYRLSISGHLMQFGVRQIGSRAIELPSIVVRANPIGSLGVSQGSLHYAWNDQRSQLFIWTFFEAGDCEDWTLKHTICLNYFDDDLHSRKPFSVYAFHPTSDMLFIGNPAIMFSYDLHTKRLENVCKLTKDKFIFNGLYMVFPFSVNLTPLDTFSHSTIEASTGTSLQEAEFWRFVKESALRALCFLEEHGRKEERLVELQIVGERKEYPFPGWGSDFRPRRIKERLVELGVVNKRKEDPFPGWGSDFRLEIPTEKVSDTPGL